MTSFVSVNTRVHMGFEEIFDVDLLHNWRTVRDVFNTRVHVYFASWLGFY